MKNRSVVLDSQRQEDADQVLAGKESKSYNHLDFQNALNEFRNVIFVYKYGIACMVWVGPKHYLADFLTALAGIRHDIK